MSLLTGATLADPAANQNFVTAAVAAQSSPTITTPVINGTPTGTGVATAATASTVALRDANANIAAANLLESYVTTVTSGTTVTLTVSSAYSQFFTGSTAQVVMLPVAGTLVLGQSWLICNNSTATVTVNSSGANAVIVVAAGTQATVMCILASGTTAASWFASNCAPLASPTIATPTLTSPVLNGTISGTGTASTATASTLALRDSSANLTSNNLLESYATTVTSGTTLTLTVGSAYQQYFTGSTAQTVTMPVANTLVLGQSWLFVNSSTAVATIQSSGSNTVATLAAGTQAILTCVLASGTSAASWQLTNYALQGPRVSTTTSASTITINCLSTDIYTVTALAAAPTFAAPTGTAQPGQVLKVRIKDNGTARAITWNSAFISSGTATLLATTVISKTHWLGFIYDDVKTAWVCLACDVNGY